MRLTKYLLIFIAFNNFSIANTMEHKLPYINSQKIEDYIKIYGKPVKEYKNIIQLKNKNTNIVLFLSKKKVVKAQYLFFKSTFFLEEHQEKLKGLKQVHSKGHNAGQSISFIGKNIKYEFNNNSKKNLRSLEITW